MSSVLLPLQKLVNDALNYDLLAQQKLKKLAAKTLVLQVSEPTLTLSLTIESDGFVFVESQKPEQYDALVAGKASDLFAVMRAEDRTAAMMEHAITIEGDTRTFFAVQEVMSHLDVDWEMALADKVGDLAAHVIADGVRFFASVAKNHFESFSRTSRNFLREESGWLVPDSLWTEHRQLVTKARQDTERLAMKIQRFEQRLNRQGEEKPN
jgi:ubiquinone biosynthesis protein UbiJ